MKIGEVEDILGITRANIRYYEKEGLFSVERNDNKYRDYTEADIATVKRIIVLRKIGVSVEDIRAFFRREKTLESVLVNAVENLGKEMECVKGSLNIAKKMAADKTENFNADYYFDLIKREETAGKGFIDIYKDMGKRSRRTFDDTLKYLFGDDYKEQYSRKTVKAVTSLLLIYMSMYLINKFGLLGKLFNDMFSLPLRFFFFTVAIGIPILFARKNCPGLAEIYLKLALVTEILLSLYALYVLAGAAINIIIR